MSNFLFDVHPDTLSARSTLRLASLLIVQGHHVFYTDTSDSIFTPDLLKMGVSRISCPADLRWFTPDLVLLDYQLRDKASVYVRHNIRYLYIGIRHQMEIPALEMKGQIPLLNLPPTRHQIPSLCVRRTDFIHRIEMIRQDRSQIIIIGILEEEKNLHSVEHLYKVIKQCCITHPHYHFILLSNRGKMAEQMYVQPTNISIYRPYDLQPLLPLCHLALVAGRSNAQVECCFQHKPALLISKEHPLTPHELEEEITRIIQNRPYLTNRQKALSEFFIYENSYLEQWANWLTNYISSKRNGNT